MLLRLGIENTLYNPWQGIPSEADQTWPPSEYFALPALTLATVGPHGEPHAAPVYFAAGPLSQLYFFSESGSEHIQDLQSRPSAAASIHPVVTGYHEIRGLQLRGSVRPVPPGPEWDQAFQLYQAKFPFVAGLKELFAANTLFVFTPRWIRVLDNRRG